MPNGQDELTEKWLSLPEDRQKALLGKMDAEQKANLRDALKARTTVSPRPSHGAGGEFAGPVRRFSESFGRQFNAALLNPMGIGMDTGTPEELAKHQTFSGMFQDIKDLGQALVPTNKIAEGDYAGAAGEIAANALMMLAGKRATRGATVEPQTKAIYEAAKKANPSELPESVRKFIGGDDSVKKQAYSDLLKWSRENVEVTKKAATPKEVAAKTTPSRAGLLRTGARAITGTGERETGKFVKETVAANREAEAEAASKNAEAMAKHAERVKNVQEKNAALQASHEAETKAAQAEFEADKAAAEQLRKDATETGTRRGELARQVNQTGARLVERVKSARVKAKRSLDQSYGVIRERIGDASVPANELSDVVTQQENETLAGSRNKIAIFKDILKRAEEGNILDVAREEAMQNQGMTGSYDSLPPERRTLVDQLASSNPLLRPENRPPPETVNFHDARGYESELGRVLRNYERNPASLDGDVARALGKVRDQARKISEKLANQGGVGPLLRRTNKGYADFKQTFDEPTGKSGSGSPLAKTLDAKDPAYAVKPLSQEETAQRLRNMLKRFDPPDPQTGQGGGAALYDNFAKAKAEYDGLPKQETLEKAATTAEGKVKAPEVKPVKVIKEPKAPELVKPEIKKIGVPEVEAHTAEGVGQAADRIAKSGAWLLPFTGMHAIVAGLSGHFQTALAAMYDIPVYLGGRQAITRLLDKPEVVNWISKATPGDIKALESVPPEYRSSAAAKLAPVVAEAQKRGITVSPSLAGFVAANAAKGENDRKKLLEKGQALSGPPQ